MSPGCAKTDVWILPCPGLSSKPSGSSVMKQGISYCPDMAFPGFCSQTPTFFALCQSFTFIDLFDFYIWEKSVYTLCWDETCHLLASAHWILELHVCTSKSNFQLLNRTEIGLYLSLFLNLMFICKIDNSMELENSTIQYFKLWSTIKSMPFLLIFQVDSNKLLKTWCLYWF